QPRIAVRVGAAGPRRDGDLTNDFGPELAPLGVLTTLAVLDIGPFAVSGHDVPEGDIGKSGILPWMAGRVGDCGNPGPQSAAHAIHLWHQFCAARRAAMPDPIIVAQNAKVQLALLPALANRHGCITGATGTGKTVTLQGLAETFARIGAPVFMADVQGDLTGISQAGAATPKLQERLKALGLPEPAWGASPAVLWDVFGEQGLPVRATVSDMGPLLLSRMLELNDTQEGVLTLVFRVADDEGQLLLDLKDL